MSDVIRLAAEFVDIPSVSGEEQCFAERVAVECERMGCVVTRQEAAPSRFNLYASKTRSPRVIFCSHLDTVPPFFGARLQKEILYGRGACDAKGIIAAQLTAGKKLFDEGVEDIAFLYLVGEEVDHIGARKALELGIKVPYLVIGEPTELKMARGSKGIVKCSIQTAGRKAHSAYPERGESAVLK
ncbi:MAG: M20/M25/M40 family metallo-hydrolase, partial [Deltaproteobacteria bacterium]|nr:M20/M25/M40 family metallo-hydrolase [Deltaproteobacteria bacterium]